MAEAVAWSRVGSFRRRHDGAPSDPGADPYRIAGAVGGGPRLVRIAWGRFRRGARTPPSPDRGDGAGRIPMLQAARPPTEIRGQPLWLLGDGRDGRAGRRPGSCLPGAPGRAVSRRTGEQAHARKLARGAKAGFRSSCAAGSAPAARSERPRTTIRAGSEVDAFLVEALRGSPRAANGEGRIRQEVYLDWVSERLAPVVELDRPASSLVRFRRTRVARKGGHPEGPEAVIHGVLVVVDPRAFAEMLARGVGRHRAYGYGMLLLRPPGRPTR